MPVSKTVGLGSNPSAPATLKKKEKINMIDIIGMVLGVLYYMLLISLGIFGFWGFGKWLWEMLTYFDS